MNVVIPMAGAGKRFLDNGISTPKPLVDVFGKSMIQRVVESIDIECNFIFIVRKEHYDEFDLNSTLNKIAPSCKIVIANELTEGAACTVLLAKDHIDNNSPLLICDSDSLVYFEKKLLNNYLIDGAILTFKDTKPCWSYVESSGNLQRIKSVQEKNPISEYASSGRYYWKHGKDFVFYAEKMIQQDIRSNGEFYVSPVYNLAIAQNKYIMNILVDDFFNLGTVADLNDYVAKISNNNL
jgi:dTDP-glucose pyrophosphorylase